MTSSATAGPAEPVFVGMTVDQALASARSRGLTVRIWRLPASVPAGTVMQQVSEDPVFLVVSTPPSGGPPNGAAPSGRAARPPRVRTRVPARRGRQRRARDVPRPHAVNVAAWDYFAASKPPMLALGRAATECAVARAYDDDQLTAPMNFTVFELASAYYGWSFGPAFTDQLAGSRPPAVGCAGAGG